MKQKPHFWLLIAFVMLFVVACGSDTAVEAPTDDPAPAETAVPAAEETVEESPETTSEEDISGTITVLTNRTDIVDTTFVEYAARFNEMYPNVTVEFEAVTDYEGEVKIRMNTEDYGDVLLIPNDIPNDQLADFFEPLGSVADLEDEYIFVTEKSSNDVVYGIPVVGNLQGIVYNKAVLAEAGITELPTTSDAFLEAMQMIKDNTDTVPYYTNYAAGWPLVQWESQRGGISCNPNYSNELAYTDAPFAEGTDHHTLYKLMYDLVANELVETDPTTSDWELSKQLLGNGDIAAMVLGSWSIVQMEEAAENPADIGYMPFPHNVDGTVCASAGGDYKIAVNKNSPNKAAAEAWLWWFLNESGFAYDQGGIPPQIGSEYPPQLQAFADLDVQFVAQNPAPTAEEGWVDAIDSEAEVGLWAPDFRQRIVDAARGNSDESLEDIFADLNGRWAEARVDVTGN